MCQNDHVPIYKNRIANYGGRNLFFFINFYTSGTVLPGQKNCVALVQAQCANKHPTWGCKLLMIPRNYQFQWRRILISILLIYTNFPIKSRYFCSFSDENLQNNSLELKQMDYLIRFTFWAHFNPQTYNGTSIVVKGEYCFYYFFY